MLTKYDRQLDQHEIHDSNIHINGLPTDFYTDVEMLPRLKLEEYPCHEVSDSEGEAEHASLRTDVVELSNPQESDRSLSTDDQSGLEEETQPHKLVKTLQDILSDSFTVTAEILILDSRFVDSQICVLYNVHSSSGTGLQWLLGKIQCFHRKGKCGVGSTTLSLNLVMVRFIGI